MLCKNSSAIRGTICKEEGASYNMYTWMSYCRHMLHVGCILRCPIFPSSRLPWQDKTPMEMYGTFKISMEKAWICIEIHGKCLSPWKSFFRSLPWQMGAVFPWRKGFCPWKVRNPPLERRTWSFCSLENELSMDAILFYCMELSGRPTM